MSAFMDLATLASGPAPITEVAAWLDALPFEQQLSASRTLTRKQQRALWEKARAAAPLTLSDFVPAARPARAPVRHFGRNTLPLPAQFRLFEKRLCRLVRKRLRPI